MASLTLKNTRGIDLLVSSADASKQVAIQVKTSQAAREDWVLRKNAEQSEADSLFYVFVRLPGLGEPPEYYVVPSSIVAKHTRQRHRRWLRERRRDGRTHRDTSMRKFSDRKGEYRDAWRLLGLGDPK